MPALERNLEFAVQETIEARGEEAAEAVVSAVVDATTALGMSPAAALDVLISLRGSAQTWVDALRTDVGE